MQPCGAEETSFCSQTFEWQCINILMYVFQVNSIKTQLREARSLLFSILFFLSLVQIINKKRESLTLNKEKERSIQQKTR